MGHRMQRIDRCRERNRLWVSHFKHMELPLLTIIEQKITIARPGKIGVNLLLGGCGRSAKGKSIIRQCLYGGGTARVAITANRCRSIGELLIGCGDYRWIIIANTRQVGEALRIDQAWEINKAHAAILKLRRIDEGDIVARPDIHWGWITIILIGNIKG